MLKAIAFGLALGAGIQAFRQWPPDGPVTARAGVLILCVGVVCAYLGGRWHGRQTPVMAFASARAKAKAEASATATQTVQLAVFTGRHVDQPPTVANVPTEAVQWFGGERRQVEASELDGMDLSDVLGVQEYDPVNEP